MGWENRGKILKGSSSKKNLIHRFTVETFSTQAYENFIREDRVFNDRKSGKEIATFSNTDSVLYLNSSYRDKREYLAAVNESKRLTKATKISEYCNVFI